MGILGEEDFYDQLLQSFVYVHPAYIDNSPKSLCEAQMIGIPIIASNVCGGSSLIHNLNRVLVPANAPYELAYWLQELFTNSEFISLLGKNAKKKVLTRNSITKIVSELLSAYKNIMSKEL